MHGAVPGRRGGMVVARAKKRAKGKAMKKVIAAGRHRTPRDRPGGRGVRRAVSNGSIYHALRNEAANRRMGTAATKTRAEVKGSSNKPWRQKGTGRARAGDKRSPCGWAAEVFGPQPRDYSYSLPRKVKRLAMRSLLTLKAQEERILVVEDFSIQSGKTKELVEPQKINPQPRAGRSSCWADDDALLRRAGRNLPWCVPRLQPAVGARPVLRQHLILLEKAALELNEFYADKGAKRGVARCGPTRSSSSRS